MRDNIKHNLWIEYLLYLFALFAPVIYSVCWFGYYVIQISPVSVCMCVHFALCIYQKDPATKILDIIHSRLCTTHIFVEP